MGSGLLAAVAQRADRGAQWAAVALGFSIPLFTALDGALVVLVLAGWLAGGAWREKWNAVRTNGMALAALGLFGLLLLGALWGERPPGDAGAMLRKYIDLLWIAVFIWVLRDPVMRTRGLQALALSLALVLAVSFLLMLNLVPDTGILEGHSGYPVVFKGRQTHGPLMAFAAFLYFQFALAAATSRRRVLWLALSALAFVNGTLVVQGTTGYLIFAALALYLGYLARGWRGLAWALGAAVAIVAVLLLVPGAFQARIVRIQSEVQQWRPGLSDVNNSIGTRIEYYRVASELVRERPLAGYGTGGYTRAFLEHTGTTNLRRARNPHSEYLHMTVQLGVIGLAGLLALFATHWRLAPRAATPLECRLARALLLTMVIGCFFNTWLMDHTEGLLYAWLTGLLFAGLKSPAPAPPSP